MLSKKALQKSALKIISRMAEDRKPYSMSVLGKDILVMPSVFSPKYFTDSVFFAREIPKIVGSRSFLEIGTGTGIVALFVGLAGKQRIVTTDVNPAAVKNARMNFRKYGLKIPARLGDVFAPIRSHEKFDVIFWNHPFHCVSEKPESMLVRSGFDYRYRGLESFFQDAKKHLFPNGKVLLGTSNIARVKEIKAIARAHGYKEKLLIKKNVKFAHRHNMPIDLRVYSFTHEGGSRALNGIKAEF